MNKLRLQFFAELRRQLYSDEEDRAFFLDVQASIKALKLRLDDGLVAIMQLEQHLLNVACDDPGCAIGINLILPCLQARLDDLASEHAAAEAERAQAELLEQTVRPLPHTMSAILLLFHQFCLTHACCV